MPYVSRAVLQMNATVAVRNRVRRTLRRFSADRSGSTLVETALVLLILVPLFIGVAELSEALTLQRRVETAAATAADLVTRSTEGGDAIGEAELEAIPKLLRKIVQTGPGPGGAVGFRLATFDIAHDNGTASFDLVESYTCGGFVGSGAPTIPRDVLRRSQSLDQLVLVETEFGFESSFKYFIDTVTLRGKSFFAPRVGNDLKLPEGDTCPPPE